MQTTESLAQQYARALRAAYPSKKLINRLRRRLQKRLKRPSGVSLLEKLRRKK